MKLSDLEPRWLRAADGTRVLLFRCPCKPGCNTWLTCKDRPMSGKDQNRLVYEETPDLKGTSIVLTVPEVAWHITGDSIETLTVSPSIDASRSGHWHGWIRDGRIA